MIMFRNGWGFLFRSQMIWYLGFLHFFAMILDFFMIGLESIHFIGSLAYLIRGKMVLYLYWKLLFIIHNSTTILYVLKSLMLNDTAYCLTILIPIHYVHSLFRIFSYSIWIQYRISDQSNSIGNRCPIPLFIIIIANIQLYLIVFLISKINKWRKALII